MRSDRILRIVVGLICALVLCAANAHATKLIMGAGDGGSISTDPAFDAAGELQVNRNETVVFTLTPDPNYQVAYFNRSDGNPKKDISVLDTFPELCPENPDTGVVTCTLTDFTNNFWFDVTFSANPVVASFVTDQPSGSEAGISVQFTDTSEHIDSDANQNIWSWNFGDGTTSSLQNPVHTFAVGTHNVTLTVTNETTETTDSYTLSYTAIQPTITYQANAGANGSMAPSGTVTVDEGSSTTFTITPDTHYQVADVLVDGVSIGAVPSVTFDVADITDHTITASFEPIPVIASFSSDLASGEITIDDEVTFTDTSLGNLTFWNWYVGTELISTDQNPVLTFTEAGDYTVTLEVGNPATSNAYSADYTVDPSALLGIVKLEGASKEYEHLQDAYDDVVVSETIKLKAAEPIVPVDVHGNLYFNRNVTVILKGGYDNDFETFNGFSRIHGNVIISDGIVEMSEVIIAPAQAI